MTINIYEEIYKLYINKCDLTIYIYMKSSDAKASKCHLKFSSRMILFFLSNLYI